MNTSKFVLLEGIQHGNQFITTNDPTEPESEKIKLADGTIAYIILGYANSIKEAQNKLYEYKLKSLLYKHKIGYVIKADINKNRVEDISKYYSIDKNSGGYACWTSFFSHAKIFPDKKQAINILKNDSNFKKNIKMSNGTMYPPRMIHIAADISNTNPKGTVTISVVPLILGEAAMAKEFVGKIIKPRQSGDY